MAPTPEPVRQTKLYDQRFPKNFVLTLSLIQLVMSVSAILTQVVGLSEVYYYLPGLQFMGAGIWCGILFALSGVFGVIASSKPSFGWIVTFMVFSMISASFCLPLLVLYLIETAFPSSNLGYMYIYYNYIFPIRISPIQIVISLVQAAAAIVSAGMMCRALENCCGPRKECGSVDYNGSGGSSPNNALIKHITMPEQQPAYITIPMSQIQVLAASAGATALATISMTLGAAETDVFDNSPPPTYESVAQMKKDKEEANEGKNQRF